ncbi:nucleoside phosphorylase domain-containing protein [Aspergillus karnatakaensis]|uniref:nucleoside phosphorylase domain-containing protein n=1 Tax=Aspergillus karnatakaensis TaxID=1810916 RepID=UPI003CCCED87
MASFTHKNYTVGWICALPIEMAAAKAMLDKTHDKLTQPLNDHNTYTLGEIFNHKVVVACLPSGVTGTTSAATVAQQMLATFPRIRFGLMVGIGGGVPSLDTDIRLGDVVVSNPHGTFGGVVQYDFGKAVTNLRFQRTGSLNKPPNVVLTAVSELQSNHLMGTSQIIQFLEDMLLRFPRMTQFTYPKREDLLFESSYEHHVTSRTCRDCDRERVIARDQRNTTDPYIHYGLIASGNQVVKSAVVRDNLAHQLGAICFELEASGLMDEFPCLVIRGISDYADSHKNNDWQPYAAAVAAAYAKELLSCVSAAQTESIPSFMDAELGKKSPVMFIAERFELTNIDIHTLDPSLDDDREKVYQLFRRTLRGVAFTRDPATEEPLKVTMIKEILTWKFHAKGPWDIWIDRFVVDGYNLNVRDGWGRTPLHYAVEAPQGRMEKARKLLEKGADLRMMDYEGNTPVDLAQQSEDIAMLTMLLRAWLADEKETTPC